MSNREQSRRTADESPGGLDPLVFNTELAKLLQRLKRDAGAEVIRQNYRGTGSQAYRRQIWVRWVAPNGTNSAVIDLWLNKDHLQFGGIVRNAPSEGRTLPKGVPYGDKTPAQVYAQVSSLLKEWARPVVEAEKTAMNYSYDRTAADNRTATEISSALRVLKTQKSSVAASEKALSKIIAQLARMPGMSGVTGPLIVAADYLKSALDDMDRAENRLSDSDLDN